MAKKVQIDLFGKRAKPRKVRNLPLFFMRVLYRIGKFIEEKCVASVTVYVPFRASVAYELNVKRGSPAQMVRAALEVLGQQGFDPSHWKSDPGFYEQLGANWREYVSDIQEDDC